MSDPLITPADLGTLLGDTTINQDRASMIIDQAQQACEAVINPIPDGKLFVLFRVAAKAYLSGAGQSRGYQLNQAGDDGAFPSLAGGVRLDDQDRADLLDTTADDETSAGTSAFTIRLRSEQFPHHVWDTPVPRLGCW